MGKEGDSGCDGSGIGSGHCSDGPASCPQSPSWNADWISFSRFSTRALKSTNIRRIFAADTASGFFMHWSKIRAFITTSPENRRSRRTCGRHRATWCSPTLPRLALLRLRLRVPLLLLHVPLLLRPALPLLRSMPSLLLLSGSDPLLGFATGRSY